MQELLDLVNSFLTGPVMVCGVLLAGLWLSFKTRFVQVRKLPQAICEVFKSITKRGQKQGAITPFQALATALSGTIGTGNIAGVATAIAIGGAGSIFWMWVSAFFGMATKYSEIVLAVKYRKKTKNGYIGGAMYYIKEATGSKFLAGAFAVFCLLASFGIGNMTQSNTAAVAMKSFLPIGDTALKIIFIILSVIIGFVIFGGINRIAKITTTLVPFMALFYIGCCLTVIFMDFGGFLPAIKEIVTSALDFRATAGGIAGMAVLHTMKTGFTKGVFTNEAGMGSAPIVHAAADTDKPVSQGLWGIFEVFFDTIIMCSLTAVVVIMAGTASDNTIPITSLALEGFRHYLGDFAVIVIALSTILFAVSTIVGWSYYGESSVKYLFNQKKLPVVIYKLVFIALIYVGAVSSLGIVWGVSDLFNGLMMIPNLIGVILLSNVVSSETKRLK